MSEFYKNSNYRSTWRPLIRESDQVIANAPSDAETLKKESETKEIPVEENKISEESDILKKLNEISADIDTLYNMLSEQKGKMDYLLSHVTAKETATKKKLFGLSKR